VRALAFGLVFGLGVLASGPAAAGDLFDDVDRVGAELRSSEVSHRREAVEHLEAFSSEEARPLLYSALADSDLEVRVRAAAAIGRRRLGDAAPRLAALLGDAEPRMRAAAAAALGQVGGAAEAPWPERSARALERSLGDVEHEVREAAVSALGALPRALGRSAAINVTARLDDEHPGVRQKAAGVLGRLGDARAVIPLVGRLGDGSREVRMAALEALAELGDARAAPAMVRLISDSADEVRAQAIQSLGRLKSRAAVPALCELVERGSEPLRGRAAVALGQLAAGAPVEGVDPAVTALVNALGKDDLRQAAREGLRLAGAGAVAPLAARLPSANGDELAAEVELLGELGDARAAPTLLGELERGRVARERVVDALGQVARGSRELHAELAALLADKEVAVRRRAAHALQGVADERAASALADAAGDADREVRLVAIAELGRLKASRARPVLEHLLNSPDGETAAAAARALGDLGDKRSGSSLEAALSRSERRVRRDAADALGRVGDPSQVQAVMRRARLGGAERAEAIAALGGLLRGRTDPVARELLLSHAEGSDSLFAVEGVDALGALHDPAAAARLARLLQKKDGELRRHVARALGDLASDDAASALTACLADDPDLTVRAEAAWALGKLKPDAARVTALEHALSSRSAEVRGNAAAALARLGRTPEALTPLLHDPDAPVRENAALAVARDPAHRAAAAARLKEMAAGDPDAYVRAAASRALAGKAPDARADWIALYLVDFDGAPLGGARYRLVLPDGLAKSGHADNRGIVREEGAPRGDCQIEIVDPQGRS
jgi:cellulose synthase operon protein C